MNRVPSSRRLASLLLAVGAPLACRAPSTNSCDTLDVLVVDALGAPVAGARVEYVPRSSVESDPMAELWDRREDVESWRARHTAVVTTDGRGRARLVDLMPTPQEPPLIVALMRVDASQGEAWWGWLREADSAGDAARIVLDADVDQKVRVTCGGRPAPESVHVMLGGRDGVPTADEDALSLCWMGATDANGVAVVRHVPLYHSLLGSAERGTFLAVGNQGSSDPSGIDAALGQGATIELELGLAAHVELTLLDSEGHTLNEGIALFALADEADRASDIDDVEDDGYVEFDSGRVVLPAFGLAQRIRIELGAPGWCSETIDVPTASTNGDWTRVEVHLKRPSLRFAGRAVDEHGRPLSLREFEVQGADDAGVLTTRYGTNHLETDARGRFTLDLDPERLARAGGAITLRFEDPVERGTSLRSFLMPESSAQDERPSVRIDVASVEPGALRELGDVVVRSTR